MFCVVQPDLARVLDGVLVNILQQSDSTWVISDIVLPATAYLLTRSAC